MKIILIFRKVKVDLNIIVNMSKINIGISLIPVRSLVYYFVKLDKIVLKFICRVYFWNYLRKYAMYLILFLLIVSHLLPTISTYLYGEVWRRKQSWHFRDIFLLNLSVDGNPWRVRSLIIYYFFIYFLTRTCSKEYILRIIFTWSPIEIN